MTSLKDSSFLYVTYSAFNLCPPEAFSILKVLNKQSDLNLEIILELIPKSPEKIYLNSS